MSIVQAVDYHVPVMLEECLEGMNLQPTGHYVDVTFGGGGHSRAILDRLSDSGHLYSFDQDPDAAARAEETEREALGLLGSCRSIGILVEGIEMPAVRETVEYST